MKLIKFSIFTKKGKDNVLLFLEKIRDGFLVSGFYDKQSRKDICFDGDPEHKFFVSFQTTSRKSALDYFNKEGEYLLDKFYDEEEIRWNNQIYLSFMVSFLILI